MELEACADRLGSFASAAAQLGPWLREKELMMSVLGPLSIDPNMLTTQKQQAQVCEQRQEIRLDSTLLSFHMYRATKCSRHTIQLNQIECRTSCTVKTTIYICIYIYIL